MKTISTLFLMTTLFPAILYAAQPMMEHNMTDHSGMTDHKMESEHMPVQEGMSDAQESPSLSVLDKAPASGKAREAGFDNSYFMKQTTVEASDEEKCVLASRGIVMLDRQGWKKCGVVVKDKEKQSRMERQHQHAGH